MSARIAARKLPPVLQAMSTVPTYRWDSTGLLGRHRVRVRLKNAGTDDKPVKRGRNVTLQ